MHRFVRFAAVLALVGALVGAPLTAAVTSAQTADGFAEECTAGLCTFLINDDTADLPASAASVLLNVLQANVQTSPDGTGLVFSKDITLRLPIGELHLVDASLTGELAADQTIQRLRGTAHLPIPALGTTLLVDIGVDEGRNLPATQAPVDPDHRYLVVRLGQDQSVRPGGQSLTVLADLDQPAVYLDGNLTIYGLGPDLGETLAPELLGTIAFNPLGGAVKLQLHGQVDPNGDSFLQIDSNYALAPALLSGWLGDQVKPFAAAGSLRLDRDGMFFETTADSSIFPDIALQGDARLEAFVPFHTGAGPARVETSAGANLLLFEASLAGGNRLETDILSALLDGSLWTQLAVYEPSTVFVMVKDAASDAVVLAAEGIQSTTQAAGSGYEWLRLGLAQGAGSTTDAVRAGYTSAKDLAGIGYERLAEGVASGTVGVASVADQSAARMGRAVSCSLRQVQTLWCSTTGLCAAPATCVAE